MTCFECEKGELEPSIVYVTGERNGEEYSVKLDGLRCSHCGFQTVDSEQSAKLTRLLSDAYRSAHGYLTGPEIRALRAQLKMSQQEFSDYLGTGIASVKRWELGQIQDRAMDQLIRLKTDPETARRNLRTLEEQIPEPVVVSEADDFKLTLSMGETKYIRHTAMNLESVLLLDEDRDLLAEVSTIAA